MSDYRGDEPLEEFGGGNGSNAHSAFIIATPGQLKRLVIESRKNNFKGKYFLLATDFRIISDAWEPIGSTPVHSFNGIFNGGGHTIKGALHNTQGQKLFGFFGYLKDATVTNLIMETDIYNMADNTVYCYAGGIAGYSNRSTIIECQNTGNIKTAMAGSIYTGGIVGISYNHSMISHCINQGEIYGESTQNIYIGGIAGDSTTCSAIMDCTNMGATQGASSSVEDANETYIGGISGRNSQNSYLIHCINHGTVAGNSKYTFSYVGGISGQNTYYCSIKNCSNLSVAIECNGKIAYAGGIVGNNDTGSIIDFCKNQAMITSLGGFYSYSGGIVGLNTGSYIYDCCKNSGIINKKEPTEENNFLRAGGNVSAITACPNGHENAEIQGCL